ncbi:UvrD-helicase domain-containing protein [Devosia sp.]|uniref:UvrD-helicase domain-containing protein n=1 Tax=Devosia sp. TaxID=1871048 RepID=UPI00273497FC|nr:UvrD-helicase domain-containing protein [Devosia sp.]MDP2779530.1 UvrD-helicase domain-containing protein [Devosia sp.]
MFGLARTYRPGLIARLFSVGNWKVTLAPKSREHIRVEDEGQIELPCLDIVAIASTKGLLWHTLEIRSRARVDRLPGLTGDTAAKIADDLKRFINDHLCDLVGSENDRLREIDDALHSILAAKVQYLAHADLSRAIASVPGRAAVALSHPLLDGAQTAPILRAALPNSFELLTKPAVRDGYNEAFLASELRTFSPFFDDLDGRSLSGQQREACIRLEDNNLLVASAGSGKSATMVGKVAYVLEKQLYRPEDILVLAYNKSAADELRVRIAKQLKVSPDELGCRVTTFHALGRGIIQEVEGKPPQIANWVEHPAAEAKAIEEIIQNLMKADADFNRLWIDLLVVHPKADLPRETFDSETDYLRYITELRTKGKATIGTHAGVIVKSLQEQSIANWLWLNSVAFEYERQVEVTDQEGASRHVHPDFYYPLTNTVHEHFALNADGTSPFETYVEHAESKRQAYRDGQIDFFETTSAQASDGKLHTVLQAQIEQRQIPLTMRSYEEILEVLRPIVIKHYHQVISTCIKHIRASHLTLGMLLERAKCLHDKERARIFAQVVWKIAAAYSQKLADADRIDFDSMIGDATKLVETRQYVSPYTLILVDEFQDISEPRANLITALRQQSPFSKVFAVGDDWQSIYRFAGSDISLFTGFQQHFGASWLGRLEQTYRCNQLIAETAAQFVQRNPAQLKKAVRSTRAAISKSIRVIPVKPIRGRIDFGPACHKVLERLDTFLGSISQQWRTDDKPKLKVMVLWRYNHLDPFEGRMPRFEHIVVEARSFHRAKGLEADYTVLLDISEGDYGVPSRIEDDELLHLVIPEPETFAYAEERRLFYVALTRASRGVFLLTNQDQQSRYIDELCDIARQDVRLESVDGQALRPCPKCSAGYLIDRRSNSGGHFLACSRSPECRHTSSSAR